MKRALSGVLLFVLAAIGAGLAYQAAARERNYRSLIARGDAALREEQTFGAIEAYSGAIALRPDSMLAHLRRGETYRRRGDRGDLEQAARDFRAAAALDPAATRPLDELGDVLYQLQRFGRAADAYSACIGLDDRQPRVAYKLALALYRGGNLDGALGAVTQAVRLDAQSADACYLLGLCLRDKQRLPEALEAFETTVSLSPGLIAAREELADLYHTLGRLADELEQLQLVAGLDRDNGERQVALGLAHARAGHADLAVLTLGNALDRTPDQPLIYGALGRVWLDIAQTRSDRVALSKALEALARVASNGAATSEVLTLYGRALLQDGQNAAAERALQDATGRFPVDPEALLFYATAAERQGHVENARTALVHYTALVADDAASVSHAAHIAALSLRLNDAGTAVEWLQKAAASSPNDVFILGSLADAQIRHGEVEAAKLTIARGLEKSPHNAALLVLARRVR